MKSFKIKTINEVRVSSITETEEETHPLGNFQYGKFIYKYDNNNRLIERTYHDNKDGHRISLFQFNYDDKGNLTSQEQFNSDDERLFLFEYDYDNQGRKIKMDLYVYVSVFRQWDDDPSLPEIRGVTPEFKCKYNYEYNTEGKVICTKKFHIRNKLLNSIFYEYDSKQNRSFGKEFDSENNLTNTYVYDDRDNCIEEKLFNTNGEVTQLITHQYQYNINEIDWVKCIKYVDGIFCHIISREIEHTTETKSETREETDGRF